MSRKNNILKDLLPLLFLFAYVLYSSIIRKYALANIEDTKVIFAQSVLKLIGAVMLLVYIYTNFKGVLKRDWDIFRKRSLTKFLWIALGWVGIVIVLNLSRGLIDIFRTNEIIPNWNPIKYVDESGGSVLMDSMVQIIIFITSLIIVLPKEMILRHCIFLNNVENNPTPIRIIAFALLSSLVTGLTYLSINSTLIVCVPYMFSSLILVILYWQTRNIWYSLITHFLFVIIGLLSNFSGFILTIYLA